MNALWSFELGVEFYFLNLFLSLFSSSLVAASFFTASDLASNLASYLETQNHTPLSFRNSR